MMNYSLLLISKLFQREEPHCTEVRILCLVVPVCQRDWKQLPARSGTYKTRYLIQNPGKAQKKPFSITKACWVLETRAAVSGSCSPAPRHRQEVGAPAAACAPPAPGTVLIHGLASGLALPLVMPVPGEIPAP